MTTIAFLPSRQSHAPILPVFTSSKHLTNSFLSIYMFFIRMVLGLIEKPDLENCKEFEEIETRKYEVSVEHLNSFQCKHVLLKQCNLCMQYISICV